jgi:hypothetical protein
MQKNIVLETIGWVGGIVLIIAYALNTYGVIASESVEYQGMNFLGALCFVYYTYQKKAYPNVALNLVWGIIALLALIRIVKG